MARFRFQLEGVLRHRTHLQRLRQREVALIQRQMRQHQQALEDLNALSHRATEDLRANHLVGHVDVNYLAAHRRFVLSVQRRAVGIVQQMALTQRQLAEAQQALAEAAKQRKIIEKLREKHLERWKADLARRELADMDEVGTQLAHDLLEDGVPA